MNDNSNKEINNYNDNEDEKINYYNDNEEFKNNDYNKNVDDKINIYNENSDDKINIYNENSDDKINIYNENSDDKINIYNENSDYMINNYNQVDDYHYNDKEYINDDSNNTENDELFNNSKNKINDDIDKKNKKFHKRTYKDYQSNKTINILLKQSDDIKKEYKQSIFNDVINGPHGPDVRLHKHNIVVGLLKLFIVLFFTAGIILLSVISLCITINVGYVCVQIDDTNSMIQMIFFVFYFNVLYSIIYSFWKTYLRLVHTISKSKFGSSMNDIFIKRVLGYFITLKITKLVIPKKYKSHPKDWYEKLNLIIFSVFLFIILLPFPIVAYIYGYWEVVSMFCIFFVIGGALSIIAINGFSRIIQFIKLFSRLNEFYYNAPYYVNLDERAKNQTNFLRLAYCTTNGLHGGCNLLNHILNQLIIICTQISLAAIFFGSFDPDVIKMSISLGLLIIILPLRFRKEIYKTFLNIGVNLHLFSKNTLKTDELEDKTKINAKMKATHRQYLNNIKNTIFINNKKRYINSGGNSFNYNTMDLNGKSAQFFNEEENKINLSFYNLINSKNPYFHGKALKKWNIDTLTSWKGCLTIFSLRIIKFVVGITFMAILNYYRYSEYLDTEETNHNLQNDIITHIIFVIVLLLQDIIFLIPASTEIMSMKTRKYSLNILLIMEFILVIVMRAIIINNYIPMAFILIAYANFTVHPDPRYNWDDEDTERKTLFDLFNPKFDFDPETTPISFTVIISLVISIKFSESGKKTIYTVKDFLDDKNEVTNQKPAICQWRADGISINEFCALAYACYYKNIENVNNSWLFSRPKSSKNNFIVGDNNVTSKTGVHYVDFINKESNILVVAIRGTLTMEDIFQDCYIWSASGLLQISGYFGTFITFWPREITATLVNLIVKQFTNFQLLYWVDVEKHIKELQMNTNYTLYLTGHSLGGGVAAVIASHLNIPAITFSSPGLGYSYKTYDIELKKLMRNLVNVIPMSDPIPKLDSQVGEIQYIECKTGHPFACHRIMNTLDTLNNLCHEDAVYRYWDEHTEKTIDGVPVKHNLYP
ncbi:hypothetical protein U3516DRAFT_869785 [Neocallimastix sp. 'constans']